MKLASLFTGGKDSVYAIHLARRQGHDVACLLTVLPESEDSHLLHHPSLSWTRLQAESMNMPQMCARSASVQTDAEVEALGGLLEDAKAMFGIQGVVHGGIMSRFQREKFESLCRNHNLSLVSPVWGIPPERYMRDLLDSDLVFIITAVSSDGLDDDWLGRTISGPDIALLADLSKRFGFNMNFEGGEAETFVTDCPLFSHPVRINHAQKIWDGYRGRFEIADAELNYDA